MEPCISVIVPIYKVEPYLRKCVDSILNQTYQNLEVILVDDGSPDNCGAICDEYARKDPRVKVIHKENGGMSDARNAGMDSSTGEYITFVDSDDWIEAEHVQSLYSLLQGTSKDTIAVSDIQRVDEKGRIVTSFAYQKKMNPATEAVFGYVWNKLYPIELVKEVRFPNVRYIEDLLFNFRVLGKKTYYKFSQKSTYIYLLRDSSILTTDVSEKKIGDFLIFVHELWKILNETYSYDDCMLLYNFYAGNQMCNLLCEVAKSKKLSFAERKKYAERLLCGTGGGKLTWKYADHALLKLARFAEQVHCPWLFTELYRMLICRN